ncbi:hypothetical protein FSARC_13222 [Fusarium sarcochroum]|uniref:HNH nuclease domain-containing protein n=1 Tax=Fusarium sarcochroum TaxID=1208366 RepID=A0A8H4WTN2_9HYPO|nr:hypothetical protein FSARC_13222 [Fusarium sarcochroum]
MSIDYNGAKKVMDNFRNSILVYSSCCAISGLGESWCQTPLVGPALQACHIVPQNHYHLYPDYSAQSLNDEENKRRSHHAWRQTWSAKNGILLMSHLHEAFDSRLVSINPETRRIRAFVPYNILTPYNGQEAILPDNVDVEALRHHYDMCCVENMGAEMPMVESVPTRLATSGTASPFSARTDLPATPDLGTEAPTRHDPVKRPRSSQHDQPQSGNGERENDDETVREPGQESKRRRLDDIVVKDESSPEPEWGQEDVVDSYITPLNSRQFLADVNWALRRYILS